MFTWLQNPTREQVNQVRREEVESNFRDILEDAASEPQHVMLQIASGIAMAQKVFAEKFPSFNDYAKQPKTVKAAFDAGLRDYAKRCGEVEPETAGGITIAGVFSTMIEMWGDNSIDRAQLDRSGNLLNQFMDNAKRIIDQKTKTETVPDEIIGTFTHIADMRENFDSFVRRYHSAYHKDQVKISFEVLNACQLMFDKFGPGPQHFVSAPLDDQQTFSESLIERVKIFKETDNVAWHGTQMVLLWCVANTGYSVIFHHPTHHKFSIDTAIKILEDMMAQLHTVSQLALSLTPNGT